MKNEALYHKTVDILVQAYFNDTLKHMNCYACAVGNIVAANLGYEYEKAKMIVDTNQDLKWKGIPSVYEESIKQNIWSSAIMLGYFIPGAYEGEAKEQIDATGYGPHELAMIEKAFESADSGESNEDWMFNGLMAVIDVLDKIHANTDTVLTESTKKRFEERVAV